MNSITLKPADFASASITVFPSYVSNGHWMIAKSAVANAHVFANEPVLRAFAPKAYDVRSGLVARVNDSDAGADRILAAVPEAEDAYTIWTVQPWIHVSRTSHGRKGKYVQSEAYVLTAIGGHTCYVSREYLDRFGVQPGDVMHADGTAGVGALVSPDRLFVVMPVRNDGNIAGVFAEAVNLARVKAENAARNEARNTPAARAEQRMEDRRIAKAMNAANRITTAA